MARHGPEVVAETLKVAGINTVFGIPGHTNHHLADELFRDKYFRLISPRTESGGTFMSYGFNKISHGLASVCLWHIAGVPYSMPGIHAAFDDSVPLLVIYGQNESWFKGREAVQASDDMLQTVRPIAKFAHKVEKSAHLHQTLRQAITSASSGRPRPSVVEIPIDILLDTTEAKVSPVKLPAKAAADPNAIKLASEILLGAQRPVIIAGGGAAIAEASKEITRLAELLCAPVVYGMRAGKGVIKDLHPLCFGPSGNAGWEIANEVLEESDCWLAIGTSFSQHATGTWTLRKPQTVIQIDIDAFEIGKTFSPTLGLLGDAKISSAQLIAVLESKGCSSNYEFKPRYNELKSRKIGWLGKLQAMLDSSAKPIVSWRIVKQIQEGLGGRGTVVTDVGQNTHWIARGFFSNTIDDVIIDSRFIVLGFSVSAAIGAKLARPERPVICFLGDGALYYSIAELATAASENVPIVVVVENNGYFNSNKAVQDTVFGKRHAFTELPKETDFVTVAKGFGARGETVENPEEIAPALERALKKGPYLIDVKVDPTQPTKLARHPMFRNDWDISNKPIVFNGNLMWE